MHDPKEKDWTTDTNSLIERLKAFIGLGTSDPLAGRNPAAPKVVPAQDNSYIAREAAEAAKRMNAQKKLAPAVKALSAPPKRPRL